MLKVVLTDQTFPDVKIERERLAEVGGELVVLDDLDGAAAREQLRTADAVLNTYAPLDRDLIASLERCRIIARYGIGVDNVDLDAAREHGIAVTNVPDYCIDEVADHTMALLLTLARKVLDGNEAARSGRWSVSTVAPIRRLRGQTLGLVGYGGIGRSVAARARPFGFSIVAHDPHAGPSDMAADGVEAIDSLPALLARADIVSIHVPLTDETRALFGAETVRRMRPGAILLNTARGPIVSTDAVVEALSEGRLSGAGLDVLEIEPPDAGQIADVPGLVVTPHTAYYSDDAIAESQTKAVENIVAVFREQEPRYRVA